MEAAAVAGEEPRVKQCAANLWPLVVVPRAVGTTTDSSLEMLFAAETKMTAVLLLLLVPFARRAC